MGGESTYTCVPVEHLKVRNSVPGEVRASHRAMESKIHVYELGLIPPSWPLTSTSRLQGIRLTILSTGNNS